MLAQTLSENGIRCIVSVATEYGEIVMPEMEGVTVHKGRMDLGNAEVHRTERGGSGGGRNASVCNGSFGKHQESLKIRRFRISGCRGRLRILH